MANKAEKKAKERAKRIYARLQQERKAACLPPLPPFDEWRAERRRAWANQKPNAFC